MPAPSFGAVPGADEAIEVPTSPPDPADDLHAIRERYVIPVVNTPQPFQLSPLFAGRIDLRNQKINAFTLTVRVGTVNVYLGDFTTNSGRPPTEPHFIVSAGIQRTTQTIPLAPSDQYIITLQEPDGIATAFGCFTAQAL